MPPTKKYQKEDIINAAYDIVKKEGLSGLNARRIAKELNCSVQPIFHNFENMEDVEKIVIEKINNDFEENVRSATDNEKPYLAKGMAYIKFARDYPEFFKILFMRKTDMSPEEFVLSDKVTTDTVIKAGQKVFGLSEAKQKDFHIKVWIFTHGIACLLATKTVYLTDKEIYDLLGSTTREMLVGFKENIGGM